MFGFASFLIFIKINSLSKKIKLLISEIFFSLFQVLILFIILNNLNIFIDTSLFKNTSTINLNTLAISVGFIATYLNFKTIRQKEYCKKTNLFSVIILIIALLFIAIKVSLPYFASGSFIDEYFHIGTGMEILNNHRLATFYNNIAYSRGLLISLAAAAIQKFFNGNLYAVKMIPALIGLTSFTVYFLILKQLKLKQSLFALALLIYTTSPWIIFNHFYIRSNALNELFFLLSILIFTQIIQNNKLTLINGIVLFLIIVINFLTDFGSGLNLLLFLYGIFSLYFVTIVKIQNIKLFYLGLITLITTALLYIAKTNSFKYGAQIDYNYFNFFFFKNTLLTTFFLVSPFIFKIKNNSIHALIVTISVSIFIFNLLLPGTLQILRGILYFLPLYYLVIILVLSKLNISKITTVFTALLLFATIYLNFPKSFIKTPFIPEEINYIDNQIFEDVKTSCAKSVIITASRPRILLFYNIKPDYQINTKLDDQDWLLNDVEASLYYLDQSPNIYRDADTHTPVITNLTTFLTAINDKQNVCVITGGLPAAWVNQEITKYLEENFRETQKKYSSNYDYRRMRLFFKK